MRKQGLKEVLEEIRELKRSSKSTINTEDVDVLYFKNGIDNLLKRIPLAKVRKARVLFKQCCAEWLNENRVIEQAYRAFGSSLKTKYSYWNFKAASVILLYLYGYVTARELKFSKENSMEQLFSRHREDLQEIKEIDDVLKDAVFFGHIPMNISCLCVGASIAFATGVKSVIDVMERLHQDEDYRKGHYAGGRIDWDEGILLNWLSPRFVLSKKLTN